MKDGYWLNAKTGRHFRIDEHAAWITDPANADRIGLPKRTFVRMGKLHWANPDHRAPILLLAMSAGLVRVRGHGATISFEYTVADAKALRAVRSFLEKTQLAGPATGLQLNNLKTGKTHFFRYDDLGAGVCGDRARSEG